MLFTFLIPFILSQKRICVCYLECSLLCPTEKHIVTSSSFLINDLLKSRFENDKEIELNLYSPKNEFIFKINSTNFHDQKITLRVISNSKPIKVKYKEDNSLSNQIIEINPNYQIDLPKLIPFKSASINSNKFILDDPESTPIPISVGIYQMKTTGNWACDPSDYPLSPDNVQLIGCDINNLDSPSAYECGYRCWTSGETTLEYTFKGVKFAIYGTFDPQHGKFDLTIDDGNPIEVNEYSENRETYAQIHISDELEYGEHKIKISGNQIYEIHKFVYWPSMKALRLNSTEFDKSSDWQSESDGIGGIRQYTTENGATATKSIKCSKFWIYGSNSNDLQSISIQIDEDETQLNQYSESRIDGILLLESQELDFGIHSLIIKNLGPKSYFYCVYYLYDPPPQSPAPFPSESPTASETPKPSSTPEPSMTPTESPLPTPIPTPVPISVGLTQMTITGSVNCEPSGFNPNDLSNLGCSIENLESSAAYECGYRCWTSSGDYEYTFIGVQFEIYGTYDPLHGTFEIIIDSSTTIEINEYKSTREMYSLLYISDELQYGEHHIKIKNKGETYELYKLSYWPNKNAIRINCTSFTKEGTWTAETDGIGGVREYTDDTSISASITIPFSKFWLYGSTMYWAGNLDVEFSNEAKTINLYSDNRVDGALIYETTDYQLDEYTIRISRNTGGTLTLYCLYYIDTPPIATKTPEPSSTPEPSMTPSESPLPTPIPTPIPISVGLTQMTVTGSVNCEPSTFNSDNLNNLGCSIENLESSAAYECGYRCWTSSGDYEYTFIGVQFEIYGTYDPLHGTFEIIIDSSTTIEINEYKSTREMYSLLYISDELQYGEHHIKIKNKGETYELYKLSYWPNKKAIRINCTSFTKEGTWTAETDGIGGVREYTDDTSISASITIPFSKFWLYGSTMYWAGNLNVEFSNEAKTINLYSDNRVDGALIYETNDYQLDEYTIRISRNTGGTLTLYCLYYIDTPPIATKTPEPSSTPSESPEPSSTPTATPIPTPIPISVGLTQMTVTGSVNCEPSTFNSDNLNNLGCSIENLESSAAYECGYRCWTSSGDYEYTFIGVQFEIYGTYDPLHGTFEIIIDSSRTIEINEYKSTREMYSLLYISDELQYGEHHIKIKNKGETYELYKLSYWPNKKAIRINCTSFTKEGNWKSQTDGIGGIREYIDYGSGSAKLNLTCSKVWIYGSKTSWSSDMTIELAGIQTTIPLNTNERKDGILLYESSDFSLDKYTLSVSSIAGTITLYCIYYIDSPPIQTPTISSSPKPSPTPEPSFTPHPSFTPSETPLASQTPDQTMTPKATLTASQTPEKTPEATPIPTPIPISVGLTQMDLSGHIYCNIAYFDKENIQNLGCNINNLEIESAWKCGYKCWSYGDANLTYTFKGYKFAIYGTFDPFHQKFNLIIDDQPPIIINEYNESRQEYTIIYMSNNLGCKEHTVKIIGRDEIYEIYKLVYWPREKAERINSTQFIKTTGWIAESDGIGGVREYTNYESNSASITIFCNRFWVYSSTCNIHNSMLLTFKGQMHTINLYSEQRIDGALVYESDELPLDNYTLIFTSLGISMLYCIYYINDPPPPTQTPYPSRTSYPETNETYIDKIFINYILTDQIEVTKTSPIDQISGCKFIEIIENIDFLIRLEKEIPFYDNIFDFKDYQEIFPAPLYSKYNGQLNIINCTFINSKCRKLNEGNVLSCHPDFSIDVSFESCNFINCGNSTNETIINILNKDSTINMTDCNITFKNATESCRVFDFLGSFAFINDCSFNKCGTIFINSNGSFVFTNNIVTSIYQQFINVRDLNTSPELNDNIFKDSLVNEESFIYIVHHVDEISLKNNTFENITSNDFDVYGGGISLILHNSEYLMTTIIFNDCNFIDNKNNRTYFSNGGAFQIGFSSQTSNTTIEFINCEFKRNECIKGKGGALGINIYNDITLTSCIFEENKAKIEGGAIFILAKFNQLNEPEIVDDQVKINMISINDCQFVQNEGNEGSAIYLSEEDIKIDTFDINSCSFIDNFCYESQYFAIKCSSTKALFINNTVEYTESRDKSRFLLLNFTEKVELIESSFVNCQTINDSSILLIGKLSDDSITTVSNCTFIDCITNKYSLSILRGNVNVLNSSFVFTNNKNACSGLEINSPKQVEIKKCEFHRNNNKVLNGGSFYIHNEEEKNLDKLIIDDLLFNNCLGSSFRTISIEHKKINLPQVELNNLQIHNISTGGSIYGININNDVLFNCFVFENNQFSNEYGGGYGSYLIPPMHISFNNCIFKNNYCSDNGGAFGGVMYNIDTFLELKSLTFTNCKFTLNSCLGNGGALYIDMLSDFSPIKIQSCIFEVNKASGDCGSIFIESKNVVIIESCLFVNNSAFKSLSSNSPTDSLYIHGNGYVFLSQTNFTKGSFPNEQTNYQFSHVNDHVNDLIDFNVTISYCMFSIINPNMNQLFAREVDNVGFFFITHSTFTHFFTQQNEIDNDIFFLDDEDYNHLLTDLNIPVYVVQCCFDNDEQIIKLNNQKTQQNQNQKNQVEQEHEKQTNEQQKHEEEKQKQEQEQQKQQEKHEEEKQKQTHEQLEKHEEEKQKREHKKQQQQEQTHEQQKQQVKQEDGKQLLEHDGKLILENPTLSTHNNTLNGECFYPPIIDEMIAEIENFEYSSSDPILSFTPTRGGKKGSNKTRNIIIGSVVGAFCLIAIVVSSILIPILHKKKKEKEQEKINIRTIEYDSEQEAEMTQETNDVINSKYSTYSIFGNQITTQENSFFNDDKKIHSKSSESTSSESDFDESKWANDYYNFT